MTSFRFARICVVTVIAGAGLVEFAAAETPSAPTPTAASSAPVSLDQHTLEKRTAPILKDLKLQDEKVASQVRTACRVYFEALEGWHRQVDPKLKELWAQWTEARSGAQNDPAKATAISKQIDEVYASIRPHHDAFINQLAAVLSSDQIETVKQSLTREPGLNRTYEAYLQVVPNLTAEQKAFIREKLVVGRDEAMDALAKKEKIALFKKQKVQVEAYIKEQGYDWKKLYAAYAAKIKMESQAAKKRD